MSRFFVGQQVRKVRTLSGGRVGHTARIVALVQYHAGDVIDSILCHYDGDCIVRRDEDGRPCTTWLELWEPITPPHVAGSWEVIEQLLPNIREGVAA